METSTGPDRHRAETDNPTLAAHERLVRDVQSLEWYHTLDLGSGVTTPGWFDLRGIAEQVPLPASLAGKRCLDVGTFDGFWAFEMERRGSEEVVAIDLLDPFMWDWPADTKSETIEEIGRRKGRGEGFEIARKALGSSVRRMELSVYDLDPEQIRDFDLVYVGSLLLHLRDPVKALERVRSVCRGTVMVVDAIDLLQSRLHPWRPICELDGRGRPWWWKPNRAALVRMVQSAGFRILGRPKTLMMPAGTGQPAPSLNPRLLASHEGRLAARRAHLGDPHAAVHAAPA